MAEGESTKGESPGENEQERDRWREGGRVRVGEKAREREYGRESVGERANEKERVGERAG